MGQRIRDRFQRRFAVIWIVATVLFVGFGTQLRADEHLEPNRSDWVQTNGPYGGEILAIHEAPKGVLFAGTSGGGIFRSTDRGDTWSPVNTGLHFEPGEGFVSVRAFAQKGGLLYAGTTGALYASTDGGDTWHHVPIFGKRFVSVSDIMFVGARVYVGTLNRGVWYSDDRDSWRPVIVTIGDRIYTATLNRGVWYSDDNGDSWWPVVPLNERPGAMLVGELSSIGTTLVVGTENAVCRQRTNEDALTTLNDDSVEQRINAFAAMDNLLFAGGYMDEEGSGLFRSDDEGDSWTGIAIEEMTHTVEAMAVYGTTLYAGTSGNGVFRSDDKGDSWTAVNDGLTHRNVSTLLAVNEDTVYVGTSGGGIFRTTDGGNSWVEINTGITNATIGELEVVGDRLYTHVGGKLVYTVDRGESWQPVRIPSKPIRYGFPTLSVSEGELYMAAFRYAPRNQGGEGGGIFRVDAENNTLVELIVDRNLDLIECMEVVGSTFYIGTLDNGVIQWEKESGLWTTNLGLEHHYIWVLSGNGENVYAGTEGDEIYRLKEGRWEPIHSTDMIGSNMSGLKWVGSTLYATSWNGGVFRSDDGGDSWTSINDGLDKASAASIGTDGTELYVGTFTGVFRWIETQKQWEPIGSLPHQILSLAVLDRFLYAGTAYNGVYKIQIGE